MKHIELLKKYELQDTDWKICNVDKVDIKIKIQTIISSFMIIDNTLCELISPEESELIYNTRDKLVEYLECNFLK